MGKTLPGKAGQEASAAVTAWQGVHPRWTLETRRDADNVLAGPASRINNNTSSLFTWYNVGSPPGPRLAVVVALGWPENEDCLDSATALLDAVCGSGVIHNSATKQTWSGVLRRARWLFRNLRPTTGREVVLPSHHLSRLSPRPSV